MRHQVGLIGAGIAASLSPALHEREAGEQGLDYALRADRHRGTRREDVGTLLDECRAAGFSGLNVTHPCKQAVVEHLDALSLDATALQAVNTVVFDDDGTTGHNTDTTGFAENFERGLPERRSDHVVLLGAGGAGTAVALALLRLGVERLTIVDVDAERRAVVHAPARLRSRRGRLARRSRRRRRTGARDADRHGGPRPGLPLDDALLRPELWVADIVYRPLETPLLRARPRARLPHARRRRDGGLPGRGLVRALHRRRARIASACCATSPSSAEPLPTGGSR